MARLPSHTSHLLQPCDIGIFSALKTYYRQEVERLIRGGAGTVQKAHFTQLYDRARIKALKASNIRSGWTNTGLVPFNPEKILKEIPRPPVDEQPPVNEQPLVDEQLPVDEQPPVDEQLRSLQTPKTSDNLISLQKEIENDLAKNTILNTPCKLRIKKLSTAAENAFAD